MDDLSPWPTRLAHRELSGVEAGIPPFAEPCIAEADITPLAEGRAAQASPASWFELGTIEGLYRHRTRLNSTTTPSS